MVKKIIMFLSMLFIKNLYGEFREVIPLENENIKKNIVTEKFEITKIKSENIKEKNSKMIPEAEEKNKKNEKIDEVIHVKDSENVKEVIEKNSVTIITEEQLKQIINNAKNSPLPDNNVEKEREFFTLSPTDTSQPDFFIDIKKTLDKYSFSDKSEEIYGGQITSKEITSDKIIDNLEFGVGVAYRVL